MLGFPLGVWMGALPDPPNSPAHFTLTLAFTEMCTPATGVRGSLDRPLQQRRALTREIPPQR